MKWLNLVWIGAPDELLYEKVVAFIHLHSQSTWSKELEVRLGSMSATEHHP